MGYILSILHLRQETKIGYGTLKGLNPNEVFYNDRESQIKAIEKTFEDVKKPVLKHHSKPGVTAVEEILVFPDFEVLFLSLFSNCAS